MHQKSKTPAFSGKGRLATLGSSLINTALASSVASSILFSGTYSNTGSNTGKYHYELQSGIFRDLSVVDYKLRIITKGSAYVIETSEMEDSPNACLVSVYHEKKGREEPASINELKVDVLESDPDFAKSLHKLGLIYSMVRTFCSNASDTVILKPDIDI